MSREDSVDIKQEKPTQGAPEARPERYQAPERVAPMTLRFGGFSGAKDRGLSIVNSLRGEKAGFLSDLVAGGYTQREVEDAVNNGSVKVAPVFSERVTDLYWVAEPQVEADLDRLAIEIQRQCGGTGAGADMDLPIMGDVVSVGGYLEEYPVPGFENYSGQPIALAGIAYAAHKGLVLETKLNRGPAVPGPLFVSKDSHAAPALTAPTPQRP